MNPNCSDAAAASLAPLVRGGLPPVEAGLARLCAAAVLRNVMLAIVVLALATICGDAGDEPTAAPAAPAAPADAYWQGTYARHVAYYTDFVCASSCPQCTHCTAAAERTQ